MCTMGMLRDSLQVLPGFKSQLQHSLIGTVVKTLTFLKPQFLFCKVSMHGTSLRGSASVHATPSKEPSPENAYYC